MKLLIVIYSLAAGGAERVTANLANHWADMGWTVTVATITSSASDFYDLHPKVRRVGLDLADESVGLRTAILSNYARVRSLRVLLNEIRPDVALGMMTAASVLLAMASVGRRNKVRVFGSEHVHPPYMPLGRLWTVLRSFWYGELDAVVALTNDSATWLSENTRATAVKVIPNAIPWPLPTQLPIVVAPNTRGDDGKLLLSVGRLSDEKGFDLLIPIFAAIADKHPEWKLVILGEGPLRGMLSEKIKALGMSQRIQLPGVAGNIRDWYEVADIYVMSSRYEGFGNTLVEAMTYGLPVISFDCDAGPRTIVDHLEDGILVPNGDVIKMEETLSELMGSELLRNQFGLAAVTSRDRFSMSRVTAQWEALFNEYVRRTGNMNNSIK